MHTLDGCHGRILVGQLPDAVRARLAALPGEWLEYDAPAGAIVVRHIQPTSSPTLPTIAHELVRMLAAIPLALHADIPGGELLAHAEESPHVVRLSVSRGGGLRIDWAHPSYDSAQRTPYDSGAQIPVDGVFCRLDGRLTFGADDPARAVRELQRLADTFEGLYPEGFFRAAAETAAPMVHVEMREANLDPRLLINRVLELAAPGTLDGAVEVTSFDERYPDERVRLVFGANRVWVEAPHLFEPAAGF
ncbi:MAG TPA: hypothetical protein VFH97_10385 [Gemmatimonadales bacterium]|nr:hypothetical protein [Gemmatimonadales bacterium]